MWQLLNKGLTKITSSVFATGEKHISGLFYSLCKGFLTIWTTYEEMFFFKVVRLKSRDLHLSPKGNYQMANRLFSLNDSEQLTHEQRHQG